MQWTEETFWSRKGNSLSLIHHYFWSPWKPQRSWCFRQHEQFVQIYLLPRSLHWERKTQREVARSLTRLNSITGRDVSSSVPRRFASANGFLLPTSWGPESDSNRRFQFSSDATPYSLYTAVQKWPLRHRILKQDFRFSRRRIWRWRPSAMLRRVVGWKLTDVSDVLTA